jgi:hypothetical protein
MTIFTEQLDLFNPSRWPKRPYCTDDLAHGLKVRSLDAALKRPYIQANPPHMRVWMIFDVDRQGGGLAWEEVMLPIPSWSAINRKNGHAHLVWGLRAPVLIESDEARRAPIRFLVAVEAAFRAALGSDPGYSGLITKNPANSAWDVLRGPRLDYDLGELAEYVQLPKHLPRRKPEEVGLGRNVTLFDWSRKWAYGRVLHHKTQSRNFVLWQAELYEKAKSRNGDFVTPLTDGEVWHIAKSVAKWTWAHFSQEERSTWAAKRGKIGGKIGMETRWGNNEDKRASARLMAAAGRTQTEIADELEVTQKTISNWLKQPTP